MRAARTATAVVTVAAPAARVLPPIDDELRFDFELEPLPERPRRAELGWRSEASGVKAAILRWLEERA